ncbi:RNA polymerase sigma factor [Candidatus Woesearchaeota archaeon]|jgi:RNA polymerase sigma-70 factor, ECF subfamily|nr:RNA polymerase sigma factor [Candidatus Woesearchaeota archaeon]MBT6044670.1 RNA polymerase sigma factor [Candidatus Woesearchaeota archaeon]
MSLSFEEVYHNHKDNTYARIVSRLGSPFDADDVFQNVFLKVYSSLAQGIQVKNPENWVARITSNALVDWHRTKRLHGSSLEGLCAPDISQGINLQESELINKSFERLPKDYGVIIDLYFNQGIPQSEIAKKLNLSIPNTRQRLHRAKNRLRERYLEIRGNFEKV